MSSVHDVAASLVRDGSVLIAPTMDADGYWFGAGNAAVRPTDGRVFLIGRYRDGGDSTTALAKGTRGRELALFDITDPSRPAKVHSWSKSDLGRGGTVLSIEGSAIAFESDGAVIVAVGTEKEAEYPDAVRDFRKPGTGVWSIDAFYAPSVDALDPRASLVRLIDSDDPEHLHVKDPSLVKRADGDYDVFFCIHSFSWTEGHTGCARLSLDTASGTITAKHISFSFFPRGTTWDVAVARVTGALSFAAIDGHPSSETVYFYDGAECFHAHETHSRGIIRPRGSCCEEVGGIATDDGKAVFPPHLRRLSRFFPSMVSHEGSGSSRYHSVMVHGGRRELWAFWQQSTASRAQPLFFKITSFEDAMRNA